MQAQVGFCGANHVALRHQVAASPIWYTFEANAGEGEAPVGFEQMADNRLTDKEDVCSKNP